jgi:GntR family transcriptional regulator
MAFWIQISPGSNESIYAQIVSQVSRAIATGELSTGEKLPAVRTLAAELVINPNTVARAYSVLDQQGLVSAKTGSGTFVAAPKLRDRDAAQINIVVERMDNIITQGLNIGLKPDQIRGMFETRLKKFGRKPDGGKRKK